MDYKYIEQLLERYWTCETSLEEESILRAFFAQAEIPAHLAHYKALFDYQGKAAAECLGTDFDERICKKAKVPVIVKARHLRLPERLRPLYRAAASVAIVVLIGGAMQHAFHSDKTAPTYDGKNFDPSAMTTARADSAQCDTICY